MDAVHYDPYAHQLHNDPYPVYKSMRDAAPVYRHPDQGWFALTRHADVFAAIHDWQRFSSAEGITLEGLPPDVQPEMISMDPPRHDELRNIVKRAFTPRRVELLTERIEAISRDLVGSIEYSDIDLARDLAVPLPALVIAELLGIPDSDRLAFGGWADALLRRDPNIPATMDRARQASTDLSAYLAGMIVDRRRHPTDDLIGVLVRAAGGNEGLDDLELLGFCRLLLVAGNETTSHLIGNGLIALARHPDQRRLVTQEPALMAAAVEETLRYDAPVQAVVRTASVDLQVQGISIAAGTKVVLVIGAANRDERVFADPDRFDLHRSQSSVVRHIAFGHGIHHCLGAMLARCEAVHAVAAVLDRFPNYRLTSDIVEVVHSAAVRGPVSLPCTPE
jgi:hypothetical protein